MKPFYWHGTKNFGDYLNSWLWTDLLKDCIDDNQQVRLIGIGSLLKSTLSLLSGKKLIFGTGCGYGNIPKPENYKDWIFYFVRGPLTAKAFELPERKSIVDGAWLVSLLPSFAELHKNSKKGVSFIPHWVTADSEEWRNICAEAGINYIDPQDDCQTILKSIASSELVITESLHGAIFADLFRTPWTPVRISKTFLSFKWIDWFQSINLDPVMRDIPHSDWFDYLWNKQNIKSVSYETGLYKLKNFEDLKLEPKSLKINKRYKFTVKIKGIARNVRRDFLHRARKYRSVPMKQWNKDHQKNLVEILGKIQKSPTLLSSDAVYENRIEQLKETTGRLIDQHKSGVYIG